MFNTPLDPASEQRFQAWVKYNKVPWQDSPTSDYDMRGFYQANQRGDPNATWNGPGSHFPDTWKTPFHKTFSNESIYAGQNAPHWVGNRLVDLQGKVLADETPPGPQPTIGQLLGLPSGTK